MKVLLVNGSPNTKGCTFTALSEIAKILEKNRIETEILQLGKDAINDCVACGACRKNVLGKCVFDNDIVNILIEKAKTSDGFVFGSPVYFAHPTGRILSVMDRAFFAGKNEFQFKPAAAIVNARRAGTTASVDVLNKYFTINNMPIVSANYWNMVHGSKPEDIFKDEEGISIMHTIGENMSWYLKSFATAKAANIEHPPIVKKPRTNFIQ